MKQPEYNRYEAAKGAALAKGLEIRVPNARELFLDIDSVEQWVAYQKMMPKLCECLVLEGMPVVTPSPSGGPHRCHIVITLARDLQSPFERIMLQSLLGSDPMREILSWQRAMRGDKVPTLFFEKPVRR
jgi:hypothetical protein